MRVRLLLCLAMLLIAAFALAQQSSQSPQQSGQQPIAQPASTPQTSSQSPMTMSQSSEQEPTVKTAEQNAFKTSPILPECATSSVERGDPKSGPSVTYNKLASGCSIPWHWHSANEQVLFVSGTGQFQAKGDEVKTMSQGAYISMPARHPHQLTCPNGCTLYSIRDGAADYHFVDTAGNEISPETALAAVGEHPAASVAAKQ